MAANVTTLAGSPPPDGTWQMVSNATTLTDGPAPAGAGPSRVIRRGTRGWDACNPWCAFRAIGGGGVHMEEKIRS